MSASEQQQSVEEKTISLREHEEIIENILRACRSTMQDMREEYKQTVTRLNLLNLHAYERLMQVEKDLKAYEDLCKVQRYADTLPWDKENLGDK